jgi:hypothetical protein
MGLFGDLLSLPANILNAPIRACEDLVTGEKTREEDRVFSKPLDFLADQLKEVDE